MPENRARTTSSWLRRCPANTTYVAGSARVNGREIERDLGGVAFDRVYAPVVARSLSASATATLVYRVRVDTPLADGHESSRVRAEVASQETPAFALEPASIVVHASPEFDDERTALRAEPNRDVRPGGRVALTLTACNAGTAAADAVTATLELPEALVPVRGASTIDGQAVRERRKDPLHFDFGRIDAGATRNAARRSDRGVAAAQRYDAARSRGRCRGNPRATPHRDAWSAASRFARNPRCRRGEMPCSEPAATSSSRAVKSKRSLRSPTTARAAASDVVLHLRADPALGDVRVFDKTARVSLDGDTIDLGTLEPYATRRLTLRAHVRSPYPDRSEIRIGASVHTRELGETPLGDVRWTVDSHPAFDAETSRFDLAGEAVLRPNQLADVDVVLVNTGTDVAHDVRLRLYVSPEARLESVDGAIREKS